MKNLWKYFLLCNTVIFISCDRYGVNETVESAYVEPLPEFPQYKFYRNGASSVDIFKYTLLEESLGNIYSRYLKDARITTDISYNSVWNLYNEGLSGVKPADEIATSQLHKANQWKIREDIKNMIEASAKISGYGADNQTNVRNRSAVAGRSGFVGQNIGDVNVAYVNEKGLVVADAFDRMIMSAIHLDKILNLHLDESVLNDEILRTKHENLELIKGKNYTELEHQWDLAYGYYARWKPLVQAEGIPILKGSEERILYAFVQGRYEMGKYQYNEINKYVNIIREELSKVVAIRIMSLLVGENTFVNLAEYPGYAFSWISQAYGLIYGLQFTRDVTGKPYYSYSQVSRILDQLMGKDGFWDQQRLLGNENVEGSLKNIASEIGKSFGISLKDIKR